MSWAWKNIKWVLKSLLFLEIARTILFKMSGWSAYLRCCGRELYSQNWKCQDFLAGLYINFNECSSALTLWAVLTFPLQFQHKLPGQYFFNNSSLLKISSNTIQIPLVFTNILIIIYYMSVRQKSLLFVTISMKRNLLPPYECERLWKKVLFSSLLS